VEIKKILQASGLFRLEGLLICPLPGEEEYIQKRLPGEEICWEENNGVIAVVLPNGEVWVGLASVLDCAALDKTAKEGNWERGLWVPLSNGESVRWTDLYKRMRNPDYIPDYIYNPRYSGKWRP